MKKILLFLSSLSFTLLFPLITYSKDSVVVGTIERPPFSYHNENNKLTGFSIELWEQIANKIDIDVKWKQHEQFSTLTNDVITNKTDLAVANISITSSREKQADSSHAIFESGMTIAVKKGAGVSYLSLIWESGILMFLGAAFLLLLVIAHIVWFFERNVKDSRHDYFRDEYIGGVWDAFWWAFIIMTMGGFENEVPKKLVNRLLAIFWIITSLFFISTLTAKITTALTVAELKTGIESYKDLSGKKIAVTSGSSHQKFLQKKGMKSIAYKSLDEMYADLKNEKVDAIVADLPILSHYATHDGASWMITVGKTFNPESYGMMFSENSEYLERVNASLLQLKEDGSYDELHEKYFGK